MNRLKCLTQKDSGLSNESWKKLIKLNSPQKIQNFLLKIPFNFDNTENPPEIVLKNESAHCLEGALLASAALWAIGEEPILVDLRADKKDQDHVIALFKKDNKWGAISKTNHAVLRYREPVYRDVRELVMSYFHEYFLPDGSKTLRSFSKEPFNLSIFGTDWIHSSEAVIDIAYQLDKATHEEILSPSEVRSLSNANDIEIKAGEIVEWK